MKKLCALFLCMTMLMSLVCVAQAEDGIYRQDEFDINPLGSFNPIVYRGNYNNQGSTTDIVGNDTSRSVNSDSKVKFEIINDDVYQGQALKISNVESTYFILSTEDMPNATDENPAYLNFKLKILDDANGSQAFKMYAGGTTGTSNQVLQIVSLDGKSVFLPANDENRLAYELDKWYDITFKYVTGFIEITVQDADGNKATGKAERTTNRGLYFVSNGVNSASVIIDEMYAIQGEAAMNLVTSDKGSVKFDTYVNLHEGFNFAELPNSNSLDKFNWYLRSHSPIQTGLGNDTSAYFDSYVTSITLENDCNGGYAPKITSKNGYSPYLNIGTVDIKAGRKAFISFKYKAEERLNYNGRLLGMSLGKIANSNGIEFSITGSSFGTWSYWGRVNRGYVEKILDYLPETWYTIVVEFQKVNDTDQAILYIYDDNGNQLFKQLPYVNEDFYTTSTSGPGSSLADGKAMIGLWENSSYTGTYYLDDFRVLETEDDIPSEAFIAQEICGLSDATYTNTPVFKAEFNQIVGADSTAKFVAGNGAEIPAVINYKGTSPFVEITPAKPLADDTTYKLDLSGVKSLGGAAASVSELSFTTLPYEVGTMAVDTHEIADGTLTLPVTFTNAAYEKLNTKLIAALYDAQGNLAWVDFKDVSGAPMGLNTFTFTGLPADTTGLTLKVFAWDNFMAIRPLYK